jgi:uncharacterized protein (TIGR00290 family)
MSWSSGKDSALALASARRSGAEVVRLLVTFNGEADRVAMHAVRRKLVVAQADRLGIPVFAVDLPSPCTNSEYEARLAEALGAAHDDGVDEIVFGDLFLEDIRAYRELAMAGTGVVLVFPLWGRPTAELAREMIDVGIRAVVTCVDPRQLDASFAGRWFDRDFLRDLPPQVDPCGERGEFHTFVWDAPGFSAPIDVTVGSVVERDGFVFGRRPPVPTLSRRPPVSAEGLLRVPCDDESEFARDLGDDIVGMTASRRTERPVPGGTPDAPQRGELPGAAACRRPRSTRAAPTAPTRLKTTPRCRSGAGWTPPESGFGADVQ